MYLMSNRSAAALGLSLVLGVVSWFLGMMTFFAFTFWIGNFVCPLIVSLVAPRRAVFFSLLTNSIPVGILLWMCYADDQFRSGWGGYGGLSLVLVFALGQALLVVWLISWQTRLPPQPSPRNAGYADFVSIALGCASCPTLFSPGFSPIGYAEFACAVLGCMIGFRQRDSFWGRLGLVLSAIVPVWFGVGWLEVGFYYLLDHIL